MFSISGDAAGHHNTHPPSWRVGGGLYRSVSFLTLFAMLFGGLLLMAPAPASAQSTASTTDYLNLRTGPSLDSPVVTVMPIGASVSINGGAEAGYYPVSYGSFTGYAHGDWLSIGGGGSGSGVATDGATGTRYVFDGLLNLRSGPSLSHSVISVMPDGAAVSLTGEYANGFVGVVYNGTPGFAFAEYLTTGSSGAPAPAPGGVATDGQTGTAWVIAGALNLRNGASLNNAVITVMPDGAQVTLTGEYANGFLGVTWNGTSGFAYGDYLTTSNPSPSQPAPDPGTSDDGATGSATVTEPLNLRSGPSLGNAVITVMPTGATVTLTGEYGNGYLGVTWNGMSGFAHGDWLSTGGGSTAPAPAPSEPDPTPAPTTPPTPAPDNPGTPPVGDTVVNSGYVHVYGLNLRTGPSTANSVITTMFLNEPVDIMGDPQGGFYPVRYYGFTGWASSEFITIGSAAPQPVGNEDIVAIITAAAEKYGQSPTDMLRVARCESVFDPNAVNPYSNASGLFQFLPGTWKTTPFADQDIFDPTANAEAAAWMWSNGRRNEWTCQ